MLQINLKRANTIQSRIGILLTVCLLGLFFATSNAQHDDGFCEIPEPTAIIEDVEDCDDPALHQEVVKAQGIIEVSEVQKIEKIEKIEKVERIERREKNAAVKTRPVLPKILPRTGGVGQ